MSKSPRFVWRVTIREDVDAGVDFETRDGIASSAEDACKKALAVVRREGLLDAIVVRVERLTELSF